jgi:succinoglycan biosynthesis protein ExoO
MSRCPDVSIIVAAFNAEQHINRALASALAQTEITLEVIVSDDASTDRTIAVVEAAADDRLRLVKLPMNGGPGAARNAAIEVARGEWMAILDADDSMDRERLAKLIATARAADADIVADNLLVDGPRDRALLIKEPLDDGSGKIDFVSYVLNNRPTKPGLGYGYLKPIFRASFLRKHELRYDPRLRIGEDFMIVAEMLIRGAVYVRRRSAGYIYRKHADSISYRLGAGAAQAMVDADIRFLREHVVRMSASARAAMVSHARSAKDAAAYARCLEALKRRNWSAAVVEIARRPAMLELMKEPLQIRLARLGFPLQQKRSAS